MHCFAMLFMFVFFINWTLHDLTIGFFTHIYIFIKAFLKKHTVTPHSYLLVPHFKEAIASLTPSGCL